MKDIPIPTHIKVGRKIFEIQSGDYIIFNGSCYQFVTGDKRRLYYKNYTDYTHIILPNKMLKKIPLNKLRKVESGNNELKMFLICYYF
jgi:hypothetical protein